MIYESIIPLALAICAIISLKKRENAYDLLIDGAASGLRLMKNIVPSLVILLSSVSMLRGSGFLEQAQGWLRPMLGWLGIPPETALILLVRPLSGSAALAVGTELIHSYGPDSLVGRTAAVMLGSTETTFYTISVYFGACGIRKTRYAVPAALIADAVGFLAASWTVRWMMG